MIYLYRYGSDEIDVCEWQSERSVRIKDVFVIACFNLFIMYLFLQAFVRSGSDAAFRTGLC